MNRRSGGAGEDLGLSAAMRRFPIYAPQIQELFAREESFRGMCDDLAAAEQVLTTIDQLPETVRTERRVEYEGLVEDLAQEIEQALQRVKIIPISRPPKH
ncbi:hypothetical protein EPK84_09425 (plasmid) [Sinorhizobium fredii]|nr:hypothetical protein [Sinorhizobium fredii]MQW98957.1 hypothetical protein [Sinorhizobium fredii]UTY47006.1 hypothetical protein EPK84_09425 [Sinorhizobium fredii]